MVPERNNNTFWAGKRQEHKVTQGVELEGLLPTRLRRQGDNDLVKGDIFHMYLGAADGTSSQEDGVGGSGSKLVLETPG